MKTHHKTQNSPRRTHTRNLTLGELIAATYNACGKQGTKSAKKILQLALESDLVRFAHRPSF